MASKRNSFGKIAAGSMTLRRQGSSGIIEIDSTDPDVLMPADVVEAMPDPFCHGLLIYAQAGTDRVMVHFPADLAKRDVAAVGVRIVEAFCENLESPAPAKMTFRAEVRGDWYLHNVLGSKTFILALDEITLTETRRSTAENISF